MEAPLLLFLLGCGYASYYPQPVSRTAGMLDTGLPGTDPPTSDVPCGAPAGGSIHVVIDNYLVYRYELFERLPDCSESFRGVLEPSSEAGFDAMPGNIGVVREENGTLTKWFALPTDGAPFYATTVP